MSLFTKAMPTEYRPGDVILCDAPDGINDSETNTNVFIPFNDRFLHTFILGPNEGREQVMLPMVLQDINTTCGVTVFDTHGDMALKAAMAAERAGRKYLFFDPTMENCPKFNPLVGHERNVEENLVSVFLRLPHDNEPVLPMDAEFALRYGIRILKRLDAAEGVEGKYANLDTLTAFLANRDGKGKELVEQFAHVPADSPALAHEQVSMVDSFLNDYFTEGSELFKKTEALRAQLDSMLQTPFLRNVLCSNYEKDEQNELDFQKNFDEGSVFCLVIPQDSRFTLAQCLNHLLMNAFLSAMFDRVRSSANLNGHMVYFDDFKQLSQLEFYDLFSRGTDFRLGMVLGMLSTTDLNWGGRDGKNFLEQVRASVRNIVMLPGISPEDAQYYAEYIDVVPKKKSFWKNVEIGLPMEERIQYLSKKFGDVFSQKMIYLISQNGQLQTPKEGKVRSIAPEVNAELADLADAFLKDVRYISVQETEGSEDSAACLCDK